MNNSKRKLLSTIGSLALVLVIAVGGVIGALAALSGQVSSGFNISYTAHNVHARVIGQCKQGTGAKESLGADIVFEGPEDNGTTKGFDDKTFTLTGPNDVVEVYYAILNTSDNQDMGFGVDMDISGLNLNNFEVKYSFQYFQWPVEEDHDGGDYLKGAPEADFSLDSKPTGIYLKQKGTSKSCALIGMQFKVKDVVQEATVNGTLKFNLDSSADEPVEVWNKQSVDLWNAESNNFDTTAINHLLQLVSKSTKTSITDLSKLDVAATAENQFNIAGSDAENFRNNNNGENIIVTLGGLAWHVCYLSKDKNGNDILTLWLRSSQQDAWKDRKSDEGQYYGFLDGSLYSDWAANWAVNDTTCSYPCSMYGTSYIRAVTLNNGGEYVTSGGKNLLSYTKNKESLFALFTIEELGLANYIVKPKDVDWQKNGQLAKQEIIGFSYNMSNENWQRDIGNTGFYRKDYNYSHKEKSDAWSEDYLWLPSMSETGYNSGTHGLWQLDVAQRKNGSLSSTSSVGKVGQTSGAAYNYSWLRSAHINSANISYTLSPSGSDRSNSSVSDSYAVRPALHLNLTKIANELAAAASSANVSTSAASTSAQGAVAGANDAEISNEILRRASLAQNDTKAIENDTKAIQKNGLAIENDTKAIQKNGLAMQKHTLTISKIANEILRCAPLAQNDTKAIENDTKAIENDTKAIQKNGLAIQNDTKAIENDTKTSTKISATNFSSKLFAETKKRFEF